MKKVTINDFIAILKVATSSKKESGSNSINGQFASVDYKVSSVLKNSYYAKSQTDKTDKNPYWGRDITAIKSYSFSISADYGKMAERDGKELLEENRKEEFVSIIPNLIFQHIEKGTYYIQVISKAYKADYFIDGEKMTERDFSIIAPYKKPNTSTLKSEQYKKLRLDKVLSITFNGETYELIF